MDFFLCVVSIPIISTHGGRQLRDANDRIFHNENDEKVPL